MAKNKLDDIDQIVLEMLSKNKKCQIDKLVELTKLSDEKVRRSIKKLQEMDYIISNKYCIESFKDDNLELMNIRVLIAIANELNGIKSRLEGL